MLIHAAFLRALYFCFFVKAKNTPPLTCIKKIIQAHKNARAVKNVKGFCSLLRFHSFSIVDM